MITKCNTAPFAHVFMHYGTYPTWDQECECKESRWSGHHPITDGREEIEPFIKHRQADIKYAVFKMI